MHTCTHDVYICGGIDTSLKISRSRLLCIYIYITYICPYMRVRRSPRAMRDLIPVAISPSRVV